MRSYLLKSMASVFALLALLVFAGAGTLMAQDVDSKPKIRGNFGSAFGQRTFTVDNDGDTDPTNDPEDIEGLHASIEANLFFEGSNGPISYQYRMRFRGRENQAAQGDQNLFVGNNVQTFRGYARWHVTDSFDITIGKYGGTRQTSGTENDPVQLHPYPLYFADLADAGMIDFTFNLGGGQRVGAMLSPDTAGNMTTNGQPRLGALGGGRNDADNNNMTIAPYFDLKFGAIAIGGRIALSSGDMDPQAASAGTLVADCDPAGTGAAGQACTGAISGASAATEAASYDATGIGVSVDFSFGAGILKIDIEQATSDIAETTVGTETVSEEESTGLGVKLVVAGLNAGFATATQEVGAAEFTQTDMNAHYRIGVGPKGWIAPEISIQTKETTGADGEVAGETTDTGIRLLFQVVF